MNVRLKPMTLTTLAPSDGERAGVRGGVSRPTEAPPSSLAAFTLIELIIAVAISAIVLASVSTLFFGAVHLRARASETAEMTLPVDRAVAIMKRDLEGVVPVGKLAGPMGSDAIGIGMIQPSLLEIFTGSASIGESNPWGDVQKIDYSLQAARRGNALGHDLVRGVTRNLLDSTGTTPPEPQVLLRDVQTLQFSYYDGTNWNDTWSTTLSNIPIAVKVLINFVTTKNDTQIKPPVNFLVPIVTWSNTNSITNQLSN